MTASADQLARRRAGRAPETDRARAAAAPGATRRRAAARPIEHRVLLTATMCLLALGAVMVYSASSPEILLPGQGGGGGTTFLVRYLIAAGIGLVVMHVAHRRGLALSPRATPVLVVGAFVLLCAVLVPGIGSQVNGARRWIGGGAVQLQPSELMKVALVLYAARVLAERAVPSRAARRPRLMTAVGPIVAVGALACLLVALQPDLGTALVIAFTLAAMLVAGGVPLRWFAVGVGVGALLVLVYALIEPYRQARLTSFLNPWADAGGSGFQAVQGQIALGSGGLFGVGLGRSVEKAFYLPEAHTDFILAVIGEELGVLGVGGVLALYAMIAWAGMRAARRAAGSYAKLLAAGLTSLILCQATLNIFVVLGLAPLTGVPLPFISYGSTNLIVLLGALGVLLNIARRDAPALRTVGERPAATAAERERRRGRRAASAGGDRRRRDRGARRAGAGGRRRAAG